MPKIPNTKLELPKDEKGNKREVSVDAVYREMYTEMRRFRDYEFTGSTWYNASLLAILGSVIFATYGDDNGIRSFVDEFGGMIFFVSLAIAFASSMILQHATERYRDLREWVNDLEPSWKRACYEAPGKDDQLLPNQLLLVTPWFIVLLISAVLVFANPEQSAGTQKSDRSISHSSE